MKVVHLNTADTGGAGRAVSRLSDGLRRLGHESTMLVAQRRQAGPAVAAIPAPGPAARVARRVRWERIRRDFAPYSRSRPAGHTLFSDDRSPFGRGLVAELPPADVLNLHWVAGLVDYGDFLSAVPRRAAVVWTLHDMNPFTGGCHYDLGCGRYDAGCGACPQLGSRNEADLSRRVWERKKKAFDRLDPERLDIVTPSRWLAGAARGSALLGRFRARVIPNGVDTAVFAPCDRREARERLGLPPDAQVLLCVGGPNVLIHKGFSCLSEALAGAAGLEGLHFMSVGSDVPDVDPRIRHLRLGAIDEDSRLCLAYGAADFSVCPSIQDNFPNIVLESLACGTPVVAFDAGGIPDAVRPGVTGYLAPAGNPAALRDALVDALRRREGRESLRAECRRVAVDEYAVEVQARRYAELYRELLSRPEPGVKAR